VTRGANLGAVTAALMLVLAQTNVAEVQAAIVEALQRGVPHLNAVRLALARRREQRGELPPVGITLPAHLQARDRSVQLHALETYHRVKEHCSNIRGDTLRTRAEALHTDALARGRNPALAGTNARLGGAATRPPQPGASPRRRTYRPLQAALRLRLELAQALQRRQAELAFGSRPLRSGAGAPAV
jgi:hypothetical protein